MNISKEEDLKAAHLEKICEERLGLSNEKLHWIGFFEARDATLHKITGQELF